MMLNFLLRNVESGEDLKVTATSRDILVWEKTSRSNESFTNLVTAPHLAQYYRVSWIAAKRLGEFDGTLHEWEDQYDLDLDRVEEGSIFPTRPAPTTEQ